MSGSKMMMCVEPLSPGTIPARTRGPLGLADAADPNARVCEAGDTPGPTGFGGDSADISSVDSSRACVSAAPVLVVDLDKMKRLLYSSAYMQAVNELASLSFWASELELAEEPKIRAAATKKTDQLIDQLLVEMSRGAEAVQKFLEQQEQAKQAAVEAFKSKQNQALAASRKSQERMGEAIRFCAGVKFVSTVTVKTLGAFAGWMGGKIGAKQEWQALAIDLVYSSTVDALSITKPKGVVAVVGDEAVEELVEGINELIADKVLLNQAERNQLAGWVGNYRGNAAKIHEQLAKIEQRILKQSGKGKSVQRLLGQQAKKLSKLSKLRTQTANRLLRSAGTYKKALGGTATLVFLAQDIKDAWEQLEREYALSNP